MQIKIFSDEQIEVHLHLTDQLGNHIEYEEYVYSVYLYNKEKNEKENRQLKAEATKDSLIITIPPLNAGEYDVSVNFKKDGWITTMLRIKVLPGLGKNENNPSSRNYGEEWAWEL